MLTAALCLACLAAGFALAKSMGKPSDSARFAVVRIPPFDRRLNEDIQHYWMDDGGTHLAFTETELTTARRRARNLTARGIHA